MRARAFFEFDRIPDYIAAGYVDLGPSYSGEYHTDSELEDVDVEPPPGWAPTTTPWTASPPARRTCATAGEDAVDFTVFRWTRGEEEAVEYWLAREDFFYARRRGDWYLAVCCITGHPSVLTPRVNWGNGDGSTFPDPRGYETVEELMADMAAIGREFVKDQCH